MADRIGFLGAGQMGEPMVRRLLSAGQMVTVYARRPEVRQRLSEAGAEVVDGLSALSDSAIVISCLFSDAQQCDIVGGADGLLAQLAPGSLFVSHTTGTAATLRALAAANPDVRVLDAPVSGTSDDIAAGRLTVLIGGEADDVDCASPVLGAYASPIIRTGALGTALNIKLINNVLFAANAQLLAAAVALGEALGVDSAGLLDALTACSADSTVAAHVRAVGGIPAFAAAATPFLRKDVAAAASAARDAGAGLGLLGDVLDRGPLDVSTTAAERY